MIADGIIAMEGDGPLNGIPRALNRLVLADDPVAADSVCAELMGVIPKSIPHIHEATKFLGNAHGVAQLAESRSVPVHPFLLPPGLSRNRPISL